MAVPTILNPWAILAVVVFVPIAAAAGYMKGNSDGDRDCRLENFEDQLIEQGPNPPNVPR